MLSSYNKYNVKHQSYLNKTRGKKSELQNFYFNLWCKANQFLFSFIYCTPVGQWIIQLTKYIASRFEVNGKINLQRRLWHYEKEEDKKMIICLWWNSTQVKSLENYNIVMSEWVSEWETMNEQVFSVAKRKKERRKRRRRRKRGRKYRGKKIKSLND